MLGRSIRAPTGRATLEPCRLRTRPSAAGYLGAFYIDPILKRASPCGQGGFTTRLCLSFHSLGDQGCDQAGRLRAGNHDPVAGEKLVIGQRVASILDAAPVDFQDLVRLAY